MKEEKNKPKHFNYFNFFLILILVVMLNSLFLPSINSRIYEEVDYSTFLTQVEAGQVSEVQMSDTEIVYNLKETSGFAKAILNIISFIKLPSLDVDFKNFLLAGTL